LHIGRHLTHPRGGIHGIRGHTGRIVHVLHIRRHKCTWRSRRWHSRHHRLTRIISGSIIHIRTSGGSSSALVWIFLIWRRRRHDRRRSSHVWSLRSMLRGRKQ